MTHRVLPGDKTLPAAALNAAFAASGRQTGGGAGSAPRGTVYVQNNSGTLVERFGVLGVDGVVVDHATNDAEFLRRVLLAGNEPAIETHRGNFVVCLEPIDDGNVGRCAVVGLVQVQVDVIDALHGYADIKDADLAKLQSSGGGSARIVWKEAGTGTKWALVALGEPGGGVRLRVHTVSNDYLVCHTWDGTTEGTDAINVAKPWKLRHDKDNYAGLTTLTTTNSQEVDVGDGTDTETWVVTPSYEEDDEIYAEPVQGSGVTVSSVDLSLVDMNADGRAWRVEA